MLKYHKYREGDDVLIRGKVTKVYNSQNDPDYAVLTNTGHTISIYQEDVEKLKERYPYRTGILDINGKNVFYYVRQDKKHQYSITSDVFAQNLTAEGRNAVSNAVIPYGAGVAKDEKGWYLTSVASKESVSEAGHKVALAYIVAQSAAMYGVR